MSKKRQRHKQDPSWDVEEVEVIAPKTEEQQNLIDSIHKNDITIVIGPAGTGKTLMASYAAVQLLDKGKVGRIILTRPVVEAQEHLGFLPGTLNEKLDPYMQPLYNCMYELAGPEQLETWKNSEVVKVAPLAYMRGSTFKDSFMILDEAQNATTEQMKMFLTRLGQGSKMVVNGDVTQIDLPNKILSGLVHAAEVLQGTPNVGVVHMTSKSILRHKTVQSVIEAYDNHSTKKRRHLGC